MTVFSISERQRILEEIVDFTKQNEHIVALITVGSGSYGYNDELSDLDFVVATDNNENIEPVMNYVAEQLKQRMKMIYFKQVPPIRLQVYVNEHYLELDIGYGAYTSAAALQKHWRVIYDKSGTVNEAMTKSWEAHESVQKAEEYNKKAVQCADAVWHSLMHAGVAIRRKHYWSVVAELENARNQYIGLLGCKHSLDVSKNKETDKLPEEKKEILKRSLVTNFEESSLWANLEVLTDAIYNELERSGEQTYMQVSREQVKEFITFCRKPM